MLTGFIDTVMSDLPWPPPHHQSTLPAFEFERMEDQAWYAFVMALRLQSQWSRLQEFARLLMDRRLDDRTSMDPIHFHLFLMASHELVDVPVRVFVCSFVRVRAFSSAIEDVVDGCGRLCFFSAACGKSSHTCVVCT